MIINGKNYLLLERRGCEFFEGSERAREESDVGNYLVCTPGEMIPAKNGRVYFLGFGVNDRYYWRSMNKRTGHPLKHPIKELVMTTAMTLDTQFSDDRLSWCDLKMEEAFYQYPRKFTCENILDYVNSISTEHYDAIKWVATFEFTTPAGENFTPASKIVEHCKAHRLKWENHYDGKVVCLHSGNYKFLCYEAIRQDENKSAYRLYMERI